METNINADGWKTGTEALALCMICGGEYEPGVPECPDCKVSLSVVRRCPECHRIVSAKHTRCVYCRAPFTHELPKAAMDAALPAAEGDRALSAGARRLRAAAVSIGTFVFVFSLGLVFLHQINKPANSPRIIAKSYVLHSAELRHAPSLGSSIAGSVVAGTAVNLTGFRENDQGRWLMLDWNNADAYLPASELSAPKAVDPNDGANLLKFYLLGMESAESADEGVQAVDSYAQSFPSGAHGEELRWVLAGRLRVLSQRGGPQGPALRRLADQQYEQLAAANGKYSGKARDALTKAPSAPATAPRPRSSRRKADGLQIIGSSGTETSATISASHEVLVLTQAEIIVRTGKLSQSAAGAVVTGSVEHPIKTNGIVAIPAGAPCRLTVVSADPSAAKLSLVLTSIEINHRTYAVKSTAMEISSREGDRRSAARGLSFRLDAPLVIER